MDDPRLDNLMTYTVFHIGVYLSFFTALLAARIAGSLNHWCLRVAMCLFAAAGVAGAVIGSNIPEFSAADTFFAARIGPWGMECFSYQQWATAEHGLFWLGFLFVFFPAVFWRADSLKE